MKDDFGEEYFAQEFGLDFNNPDFVKLAEAYGVKGLRASTKEEAEQVWAEALAHQGPVVVEFKVRKGENVYPMVTQGSTIDQMLMGDKE